MNHYIERHVPTLVLCTLCEPHKPITISVIPRHYAIGHSGAQVPADWKDQVIVLLFIYKLIHFTKI